MSLMRKNYLTIILFILSFSSKAQYSKLSFYVVAHQDDWQLFMGKDAYNDIADKNTKTVFIYTTSGNAGVIGDQGNGEGHGDCNNCTLPYFRSREIGTINSIQLVNPPSKVYKWCKYCWPNPRMTEWIFEANGKKWYIKKYSYCNTVSYFLRIMDGELAKLKSGDSVKTSIENKSDHQNIYRNWSDLSALLREIIIYEKKSFDSFWLNTHDADTTINSNDHLDHIATGIACKEATKGLNVNFNYFIGYQSAKLKENLSSEDITKEAGLLAAYNQAKTSTGWWDDWEESKVWCTRSYNRTVLFSTENKKELNENSKTINENRKDPVENIESSTETKKEFENYFLSYFILFLIGIIWLNIIWQEYFRNK